MAVKGLKGQRSSHLSSGPLMRFSNGEVKGYRLICILFHLYCFIYFLCILGLLPVCRPYLLRLPASNKSHDDDDDDDDDYEQLRERGTAARTRLVA